MKKLWKYTWCYKSYDFIRNWHLYLKDKKIIGPVFYGDEFKLVLRRYLNTPFKEDWIGRLYGVINPTINNNGEFDITSSIIEMDDENTNSNTYVKMWLFKQLDLVKALFKLDNLYDYINITTKHVGPITQDNYLVIFDIASQEEFISSFKKWLWTTSVYLVIAAAIVLPLTLK